MSRYHEDGDGDDGDAYTQENSQEFDDDVAEYELPEGNEEDLEEGAAVIDGEEDDDDEDEEDEDEDRDEEEDESGPDSGDENVVDEEKQLEARDGKDVVASDSEGEDSDGEGGGASESEEGPGEDEGDGEDEADEDEEKEVPEDEDPVPPIRSSSSGASKLKRRKSVLFSPPPPVDTQMETKEEKKEDKKKVKKKRPDFLGSDEEKEDKEKSFGMSNFHHFVNFFLHDSAGFYSTSNQIHTASDLVKQQLGYYYTCATHVYKTMIELRRMRFRFPPSIHNNLAKWREFIALDTLENQLEWLLTKHLNFYAKQHDFNVVWREVVTLWWTEEQYQDFVQQIKALPPTETELPPIPKECTMVSYTLFNPNKNAIRIWKNRMLTFFLKRKDLYTIQTMLLVYCKPFNLTDKGKKRQRNHDPLISREHKTRLFACRTLFARKRYGCTLKILTSNHFSLYAPELTAMPRYELIDPEEFPECVQRMRGRPFGILYSTDMMVKLHDWRPGQFVRTTSYLQDTQPIVEYRMIIALPNLYTRYRPEDLEQTRQILESQRRPNTDIVIERGENEYLERILKSLQRLPRIPLPASMEYLGLSGLRRTDETTPIPSDVMHHDE